MANELNELTELTIEEDVPFNLVIQQHIEGSIRLGRAAELLEMPWVESQFRCSKLGIPLRTIPSTMAKILGDSEVARSFSNQS